MVSDLYYPSIFRIKIILNLTKLYNFLKELVHRFCQSTFSFGYEIFRTLFVAQSASFIGYVDGHMSDPVGKSWRSIGGGPYYTQCG